MTLPRKPSRISQLLFDNNWLLQIQSELTVVIVILCIGSRFKDALRRRKMATIIHNSLVDGTRKRYLWIPLPTRFQRFVYLQARLNDKQKSLRCQSGQSGIPVRGNRMQIRWPKKSTTRWLILRRVVYFREQFSWPSSMLHPPIIFPSENTVGYQFYIRNRDHQGDISMKDHTGCVHPSTRKLTSSQYQG